MDGLMLITKGRKILGMLCLLYASALILAFASRGPKQGSRSR